MARMPQMKWIDRITDNLTWNHVHDETRTKPEVVPLLAHFAAIWKQNDEEFLRGVYALLLCRAADPEGKANWLAAMRGGLKRRELVKSIAGSQEAASVGVDMRSISRLDAIHANQTWLRICELMTLPDFDCLKGLCDLLLGRQPVQSEIEEYADRLSTAAQRASLLARLVAQPECRSSSRERGLDLSWI